MKTIFAFLISVFIMTSSHAIAQQAQELPNNPWAVKTAQPAKRSSNVTTSGGLPANPWQGSGNDSYKNVNNSDAPEYTGTATTWNTAMGQEALAPEVNIHNMLSMTDHLRKLGYKIPKSFDNKIKNAPAKLRNQIMASLDRIRNNKNDDIATKIISTMLRDAEKASGFDTENLIGTSLDLVSQ